MVKIHTEHSKWFEPRRSISSLYSVIVRERVVLKRTVDVDLCFDNLSGSDLTLKMTSAQVIETSVTKNSCYHPDDHTMPTLIQKMCMQKLIFSFN